jgi:hypothetical protein
MNTKTEDVCMGIAVLLYIVLVIYQITTNCETFTTLMKSF